MIINNQNDFTKEDLNTLLKCARLTEIDHGKCLALDEVIEQLVYMIDNYCEHSKRQLYEHVDVDECCECHMIML